MTPDEYRMLFGEDPPNEGGSGDRPPGSPPPPPPPKPMQSGSNRRGFTIAALAVVALVAANGVSQLQSNQGPEPTPPPSLNDRMMDAYYEAGGEGNWRVLRETSDAEIRSFGREVCDGLEVSRDNEEAGLFLLRYTTEENLVAFAVATAAVTCPAETARLRLG